MSSKKVDSVVISGTGLFTPEHVISNEELVAAYNAWANKYNDDHAANIRQGEIEAKPLSSSEFIVKASGIRQRFAYIKDGILDIDRMRPRIPERSEAELVRSGGDGRPCGPGRPYRTPANRLPTSMLWWSPAPIPSDPTQPLPSRSRMPWEIDGFAFDMLVACSAATFALHRAYEMIVAGTARCVLLINPELTSPQVNYQDRDSHFIFGDVATATIVERMDTCTASQSYEILSTRP
jgi:beta-ketodecanoyl-[acyl-carrier-protein] synthase